MVYKRSAICHYEECNDNNKLAAFQLSTFNFNYGIATSTLPPRDDNNSLLASGARGLKAGVGEVVSKFDKHLGGCDGVVNGAVGVV